jgi:RNA polymerase sigma-70 factor (ECF subfamily)
VIAQTTAGQAHFVKDDFRTNESVLILVLCKKDERAFCFLYDKYAPVLYGVILKIVKSEDVTNAVLNDVFCSIWKTIDQFDEKCKLLTWLLRIANIQTINRICELKNYSA